MVGEGNFRTLIVSGDIRGDFQMTKVNLQLFRNYSQPFDTAKGFAKFYDNMSGIPDEVGLPYQLGNSQILKSHLQITAHFSTNSITSIPMYVLYNRASCILILYFYKYIHIIYVLSFNGQISPFPIIRNY